MNKLTEEEIKGAKMFFEEWLEFGLSEKMKLRWDIPNGICLKIRDKTTKKEYSYNADSFDKLP